MVPNRATHHSINFNPWGHTDSGFTDPCKKRAAHSS